MPIWLQLLLGLLVFVVAAPLFAMVGRRWGRRSKGNLALITLFLGLGWMSDPPAKHIVAAKESRKDSPPSPGDPPADS